MDFIDFFSFNSTEYQNSFGTRSAPYVKKLQRIQFYYVRNGPPLQYFYLLNIGFAIKYAIENFAKYVHMNSLKKEEFSLLKHSRGNV